ncbi:MAG: TetR/AcrR family transcriptional regulator [Pseudomonadota bacterium]
MSRPKTFSNAQIAERAMAHFWREGFYAASIDALVQDIGVSRHALYSAYGDKEGVFIAALGAYVNSVVTPAFGVVEQDDAGLDDIAEFFARQIRAAEGFGFPGPGCFLANTMVESRSQDLAFRRIVDAHLARQKAGFRHALANEAARRSIDHAPVDELAQYLTISAQGLWSYARHAASSAPLWAFRDHLIAAVEERITP